MGDPRDVAVVVVAHSSGADLLACARRVLAAARVAELVVVDNASADGSVDQLGFALSADARLKVLRNRDNPGFARACNQGAAASRAPWLAFLNPDCFVEPRTFATMIEAAAALAAPGVVGADVRDANGARESAARRDDPAPWRPILRAFRHPTAPAVALGANPEGLARVDAVSGALMLMPRAAFDAIGGFDEGYRLHAEDLDLCRRARGAGCAVAVAEQARVTHLKGTSSSRRPMFVEFHKHRGLWRYFRKFDGAHAPWLARAAVGCAVWGRFALRAPWIAFKEIRARLS